MKPIAFDDESMRHVREFAAPIPSNRRDEYLRQIAEIAQGRDVGAGEMFRICRAVQRRILRGPRRKGGREEIMKANAERIAEFDSLPDYQPATTTAADTRSRIR
jgi:hypothetical protein